MEMPDKIYLNKYMIRKGMMYPAQPPADVPEEEYIRKDALLEWVKKKFNEVEIAMETGADDPALWEQRNAFKQAIDKLNSM